MNAEVQGAPPVASSQRVRAVTLAELEQAVCYWRREARRNADVRPFAITLSLLERRYRRLVASRSGAVAFERLLRDEQQALLLWRQTLRDDG